MLPCSIAYGEERIDFALRFVPRTQARLSIHVAPDGRVLVDAPSGSDTQRIKQAVRERAPWIWRQLQALQERPPDAWPRDYLNGETHFYLGRRHPLKLLTDEQYKAGVRLWRGQLEVRAPREGARAVRTLLDEWYRARARDVFARVLADKAAHPALQTAVPPWRLQGTRTQWGSCSPKGELRLNPALVKAPKACIEYVLVHELCHLKEHNHSPRFYRLLSACLPDWAQRKRALDERAEQWLT